MTPQQLYDLDQQYSFQLHPSGESLNYGGAQEKWLVGAGPSYWYITPSGNLNRYISGGPGGPLNGTVLANVGVDVYTNPALLYNAQQPVAATAPVPTPITAPVATVAFSGPDAATLTALNVPQLVGGDDELSLNPLAQLRSLLNLNGWTMGGAGLIGVLNNGDATERQLGRDIAAVVGDGRITATLNFCIGVDNTFKDGPDVPPISNSSIQAMLAGLDSKRFPHYLLWAWNFKKNPRLMDVDVAGRLLDGADLSSFTDHNLGVYTQLPNFNAGSFHQREIREDTASGTRTLGLCSCGPFTSQLDAARLELQLFARTNGAAQHGLAAQAIRHAWAIDAVQNDLMRFDAALLALSPGWDMPAGWDSYWKVTYPGCYTVKRFRPANTVTRD